MIPSTLIERLCEQLLAAEDGDARDALFEQAAQTEECAEHLLETARLQLQAAPPEAARRAELAIALAARRGDWRGQARGWRVRAQAHRAQAEHEPAVAAFARSAACAARAGDALLAAQTQIGQVDSLGWLGRLNEALALARRLESAFLALDAREDAARVLANLGGLHMRGDRHSDALACFERAQTMLADCADPIPLARVQFNQASALMECNRMAEAQALFETCRAVFATRDMPLDTALVDANIGFLRHISGQPATAIAALERAREWFAGQGQTLEAATCDADMAEAYRELGLYPEALERYERAIAEYASQAVVYERARAETGRAGVLMALQRNADALDALERARVLFGAHRNTTRQAHIRLLRAHLLAQQGQTEAAQAEAQRAASTLRRRGQHGWAAEARFLAARLRSKADSADAITDTRTIRALHGVRRTARAWARGWLECQAEQALGHCYARRKQNTRALKHFRAGVDALESLRAQIAPEEMHVAYLRDKLSVYEDVVAALLERGRAGDVAEALEYVERAKSRLLLARAQQTLEGRLAAASLPRPTQERLERLRAELSRAYHRLHALDDSEARRFSAENGASGSDLSALEQAYQKELRAAEVLHSHHAGDALTPIAAAGSLRQTLAPDETLLEFYIAQGQVCAFVVTADGVISRCAFASLADTQDAARRLRYQLERVGWAHQGMQRHAARFHAAVQEVLAHLYDLLWRPLQDLLTTEKVIVVPHGELHGLPFHAFFDGDRYALDRWEFVYAPSAAMWHAGARRGQTAEVYGTLPLPPANALLIGVPEPGIEQVAAEVERLAILLPHARLLRGEQATLQNVQHFAPASRLVHIATHALFRADNPLFSGLKLADGWLLARDLYAMTLDCDLVTLSACQTGMAFVEAGDELFGLARGFLAAGARSLAASLWPADDAASARLMELFYMRLLAGESKAAALRGAQQSLRLQYPHPYHWAAFSLIGERGRADANQAFAS